MCFQFVIPSCLHTSDCFSFPKELEASQAVAVHLFKNWWGGFTGSSRMTEPHCGEHSATGPYGNGPYGNGPWSFGDGPYGMSLGNRLITLSLDSDNDVKWLQSPSCKLSVIFRQFFCNPSLAFAQGSESFPSTMNMYCLPKFKLTFWMLFSRTILLAI